MADNFVLTGTLGGAIGALNADAIAKLNAYQTDGVTHWNPKLDAAEAGQIRAAPNAAAIPAIVRGIKEARLAVFRGLVQGDAGYGASIGALPAAERDLVIDQYYNSGLSAADVIAAYNQHWVHGTEVRRNPRTDAREVTHDGGLTWTA